MGIKFGQSITLDNNLLAVGAPTDSYDTDNKNYKPSSGAVYVYQNTDNDWQTVEKVTSWGQDLNSNDLTGFATASSGTTLVVGAPQHSYNEEGRDYLFNAGAVYVWNWNASTQLWEIKQKLSAPAGHRNIGDKFGYSVSVDGDVLAVAAVNHEYDNTGTNRLVDAGAVFVYRKNSSTGVWEFEQKIVAEGMNARQANEQFGLNLVVKKISDNAFRLLVGVPTHKYDLDGNNPLNNAGAAFIYKNTGNTWALEQKVLPQGIHKGITIQNYRNADDNFGFSIDIRDNLMVIGAPTHDYDMNGRDARTDAGAVFIYRFNGTSWDQIQKIAGATNYRNTDDNFGYSIASDSTTLVIGSPNNDYDQNDEYYLPEAGAVYVWRFDGSAWGFNQKIVAQDTVGVNVSNPASRQSNDQFGNAVAVNNGYLAVGVAKHSFDTDMNNSLSNAGIVFVYKLEDDRWTLMQKITEPTRTASGFFGSSLAMDDVWMVVGAPLCDTDFAGNNGLTDAGAVYVHKFNATTGKYEYKQKVTPSERSAGDQFGFSVDVRGNILVIGAPYTDYEMSNTGAAWIFRLQTENWVEQDKVTSWGYERGAGDKFGQAIAADGTTLVVGAPSHRYDRYERNPKNDAGAVFIYKWMNNVWTFSQKVTPTGTNARGAGDKFGFAVEMLGNTMIVSAPYHDYDESGNNLVSNAGAIYVFTRSSSNTSFTQTQKIVASGTNARNAEDNFGYSIDLSASTLIVGSPNHAYDSFGQNAVTQAGAAWVFKNNNGLWIQQSRLVPTGTNARNINDQFGSSVSIEGDAAIVGSPNHQYDMAGQNALSQAGAAFLFERVGTPVVTFEGGTDAPYTQNVATTVKKAFSSTSANTFTVPGNVSKLKIKAWGSNNGNPGDMVIDEFNVTSGEVLTFSIPSAGTGQSTIILSNKKNPYLLTLNFEDGVVNTTGRNVTNYGVTTSTTIVKNGVKSGYFNGSSYVDIMPTYAIGTGDFVFEAWVNHAVSPNLHTLFEFNNYQDGILFRQYDVNNPGLGLWINNVNITYFPFQPVVGTWYKIKLQRVSGVIKCFVNDAQVGSDITNTANITTTGTFRVGKALHTSGQYFNGYMDDVTFAYSGNPLIFAKGGASTLSSYSWTTSGNVITSSGPYTAGIDDIDYRIGFAADDDTTTKNAGRIVIEYEVQDTLTHDALGRNATATAVIDETYDFLSGVVITDGGSGYTSVPTVKFSGGSAKAKAVLAPTSIQSLAVTASGFGYTAVPQVYFQGGGTTAAKQAKAHVDLQPTSIKEIKVLASGGGYTSAPQVIVSGGEGSGVEAHALLSGTGIGIVNIIDAGEGYTQVPTLTLTGGNPDVPGALSATLTPTSLGQIIVTNGGSDYTYDPTVLITGGNGTGASAIAHIERIGVPNVFLSEQGSDYTSAPKVSFVGGGGTGAKAIAHLAPQAIQQINVTNYGEGYTSIPTLAIVGQGSGATVEAKMNHRVSALTLVGAGSDYTSIPSVTIHGDGTNASAYVTMAASTVVMSNPGAGYSVGDIVKIAGGAGTPTELRVTSVGQAGDIITWEFINEGDYSLLPGLVDVTSTSIAYDTTTRNYGSITETATSIEDRGLVSEVVTTSEDAGRILAGVGATFDLTFKVSQVHIINAGSGYTEAPLVTIDGNATITSTVELEGTLKYIHMITNGVYTDKPTLEVSGGNPSTPIEADITINPSHVASVEITDAGSGYITEPSIHFAGGNGSGAAAYTTFPGRAIAEVVVTEGGSGYTSQPTVTIIGGDGSGAAVDVHLTPTSIGQVIITSAGEKYRDDPTVSVTGGNPSRVANIDAVLNGGGVDSIVITNGGNGFTSTPTITLVGGGGDGASAEAILTPTGVRNVYLDDAGSGYKEKPTIYLIGTGSGTEITPTFAPTSVESVVITDAGTGFIQWGMVKKLTSWGHDRNVGDKFGEAIATDGKSVAVSSLKHGYDAGGFNYMPDAGAVYVYSSEYGSESMVFNADAMLELNAVFEDIAANNFSFEIVFKPYDLITRREIVNVGGKIKVWIANRVITVETATQTITAGNLYNYVSQFDNWASLVVTYNKAEQKLNTYFNYEPSNVGVEPSDLNVTYALSETYEESIQFYGEIQKLAFWNKKLDILDVKGLKNKTIKAGDSGLRGYFTADSVSGRYLTDLSGYENNALVIGVSPTFILPTKMTDTFGFKQKVVAEGINSRNSNDKFGYSVGVADTFLAVGAPMHGYDAVGANLLTNAGAVWLYQNISGVWTFNKKLIAEGLNARMSNDQYGSSIAMSDNTLVIGSPNHGYDEAGNGPEIYQAGAVYVYRRTGDVWALEAKLVGEGPNGRNANDLFGYSVSIDGDTLVVGAPNNSYNQIGSSFTNASGAIFVYKRVNGTWDFKQKLVAYGTNGRIANDKFGTSVRVCGTRLIVGSPNHGYDALGQQFLINSGAAFMFKLVGEDWVLHKKVVSSNRKENAFFGGKVDVINDYIAVGSTGSDNIETFTYATETDSFIKQAMDSYETKVDASTGYALLLNANGVVGNTTFTNETTTDAISATGTVAVSDDFGLFNKKSIKFTGTSCLTVPYNDNFTINTGDNFIFETWFMPKYPTYSGSGNVAPMVIFSNRNDSASYGPMLVRVDFTNGSARGNVKMWSSSNGTSWDNANGVIGGAVYFDEWHHLVITRKNGTIKMFLNGTKTAEFANNLYFANRKAPIYIGNESDGGQQFTGYIGMMRFVKGQTVSDDNSVFSLKNYTSGTQTFGRGSSFAFANGTTLLDGCVLGNESGIPEAESVSNAGMVNVLTYKNSNWTKTSSLVVRNPVSDRPLTCGRNTGDKFGTAVLIRSGKVYVSAPGCGSHQSSSAFYVKNAGAVFAWNYVNSVLSFDGKIMSPDRRVANQNFGYALAYKNNVLYVTAPTYSYVNYSPYNDGTNRNLRWYMNKEMVFAFGGSNYVLNNAFNWGSDARFVLNVQPKSIKASRAVVSSMGTSSATSWTIPSAISATYINCGQAIAIDDNNTLLLNHDDYTGSINGYNSIQSGAVKSITSVNKQAIVMNAGTNNNRSADDNFGWSVATNGTLVAVGAPGHTWEFYGNTSTARSGAVYVFAYDSSKFIWTMEQNIQQATKTANIEFGKKIDLYTDYLVANATNTGSGRVDVWRRSGTNWTSELVYTTFNAGDQGAFSLAVVDGTKFAVGVPGAELSSTPNNDGSIKVLDKTSGSWVASEYRVQATNGDSVLFIKSRTANDKFGYSVKLGPNKLFVIAPNHRLDSNGSDSYWTALYTYSISDLFTYYVLKSMSNLLTEAGLTTSSSTNSVVFDKIDYSNGLLVLGSKNYGTAGLVKLYEETSPFTFTSRYSGNGVAGDNWGSSVCLVNDDRVVIGTPNRDITNQVTDCGAFYYVRKTGVTTWVATNYVFTPAITQNRLSTNSIDYNATFSNGRNTNDHFGMSVVLRDGILAVGAPMHRYNVNGVKNTTKVAGAVMTYVLNNGKFVYGTKICDASATPVTYAQLGWALDMKNGYLAVSTNPSTANGTSKIVQVFKANGSVFNSTWNMQREYASGTSNTNVYTGLTLVNDSLLVMGSSNYTDGKVNSGTFATTTRSDTTWSGAVLTYQTGVLNSRQAGDKFGTSVGIDGTRLVIGSINHSKALDYSPALTAQGAAFVYDYDTVEWVYNSKIVSASAAASANFGSKVDIKGDYILVASSASGAGRTEVFFKDATLGWTVQNTVNGGSGEQLANSIILENDSRYIVGSPMLTGATTPVNSAGGFQYVTRSGTTWTKGAGFINTSYYVTPSFKWDGSVVNIGYNSTRAANDKFGSSVALLGDEIYVGAVNHSSTLYNVALSSATGTVFSYQLVNGKYHLKQKINNPDNKTNASFGSSIKVSNGYLVVGAVTSGNNDGIAYVFKRDENTEFTYSTRHLSTNKTGTAVEIDTNSRIIVSSPEYAGRPTLTNAGMFSTLVEENGAWTYKDSISTFSIPVDFTTSYTPPTYDRYSQGGGYGGSYYGSRGGDGGYSSGTGGFSGGNIVPVGATVINVSGPTASNSNDPNYVSGYGGEYQNGLAVIINSVETKTYFATGAAQYYIVPKNVTSITFKLWGAGGGRSFGHYGSGFVGGAGNYVSATIPVKEGMSFVVEVGTRGYANNGGWPNGYTCTPIGWSDTAGSGTHAGGGGGGGGGSTSIKLVENNKVLLSAGGGAGSASGNSSGYSEGYKRGPWGTWTYTPSTITYTQINDVASFRYANDQFGAGVSVEDSYMAVGVPGGSYDRSGGNVGDPGNVMIFARGGDNTFTYLDRLVSPNASSYTGFGSLVKTQGNYLVAGTSNSPYNVEIWNATNPTTDNFVYQGTVNANTNAITMVNDDVLVVGTNIATNISGVGALTSSGKHTTFTRTGSTWAQHSESIVPGLSFGRFANDSFGANVVMANGWLAVAAPYHDYDLNGNTFLSNVGAINIFNYDANNNKWTFAKKLSPTNFVTNYNAGVTSLRLFNGVNLIDESASKIEFWTRDSNGNFTSNYVVNRVGPMALLDANTMASGDTTIAIGTNGQPSITGAGGVRHYVKSGSTFTENTSKMLTIPGISNGRNANDLFGKAVAINNDYIAIGAPGHSYNESGNARTTSSGAVFVFNKPVGSSSYKFEKKIVSTTNTINNIGNKLIVNGPYLYTGNETGASNKGMGEIWYRSNVGTWVNQLAFTGNATTTLGSSLVFVDNSTLVLGHPLGNGSNVAGAPVITNSGEFKTLIRTNSTWTDKGYSVIPGVINSRITNDSFAYAVAANRDFLIVGTPAHDYDNDGNNQLTDAGAVWMFVKQSDYKYKLVGRFTPTDRTANANFGYSVAINDRSGQIVVGAPGANKAYVYQFDGANMNLITTLVPQGTSATTDKFGASVAVNNNVIAVGAPSHKLDINDANSLTDAGAVYTWAFTNGVWAFVEKTVEIGSNQRAANNKYGSAVAISSNKALIVGAPGNSVNKEGVATVANAGGAWLKYLSDSKTPPSISTSSTLPPGAVGASYLQQLSAISFTTNGATFNLKAGTLPAGITLSTAGLLSGTPTTAGTYTFTIGVTDTNGSGEKLFTLVIGNVASVFTLATSQANGSTAVTDTSGNHTMSGSTGASFAYTNTKVKSGTTSLKITNGYLKTESGSALFSDLSKNSFTIETYFAMENSIGSYSTPTICAISDAQGDFLRLYIDHTTGDLKFGWAKTITADTGVNDPASTWVAGRFYHIAVSYDATRKQVYVHRDGILMVVKDVSTSAMQSVFDQASTMLTLGSSTSTTGPCYYDGLKVWSGAAPKYAATGFTAPPSI